MLNEQRKILVVTFSREAMDSIRSVRPIRTIHRYSHKLLEQLCRRHPTRHDTDSEEVKAQLQWYIPTVVGRPVIIVVDLCGLLLGESSNVEAWVCPLADPEVGGATGVVRIIDEPALILQDNSYTVFKVSLHF